MRWTTYKYKIRIVALASQTKRRRWRSFHILLVISASLNDLQMQMFLIFVVKTILKHFTASWCSECSPHKSTQELCTGTGYRSTVRQETMENQLLYNNILIIFLLLIQTLSRKFLIKTQFSSDLFAV